MTITQINGFDGYTEAKLEVTLTKEDIEIANQAVENLDSLVNFWGCSDHEEAIIKWVIPILNAITKKDEK